VTTIWYTNYAEISAEARAALLTILDGGSAQVHIPCLMPRLLNVPLEGVPSPATRDCANVTLAVAWAPSNDSATGMQQYWILTQVRRVTAKSVGMMNLRLVSRGRVRWRAVVIHSHLLWRRTKLRLNRGSYLIPLSTHSHLFYI
jgi:hypothetical protein